jgi:ribosome-binding factor A
VAEQMRHLIAEDLQLGALHDPRLERVSVTVAEVRVSRDLKHAVVFATELGRGLEPPTLAALEETAPRLAGRLARRMHLKYAPRLRFVADGTFAEADRVQRLIQEEGRRLAGQAGAGGEGADE